MTRADGILTISLVIGTAGFMWPGGPNTLMIAGAVLMFITGLLDFKWKGEDDNGNRSEE